MNSFFHIYSICGRDGLSEMSFKLSAFLPVVFNSKISSALQQGEHAVLGPVLTGIVQGCVP